MGWPEAVPLALFALLVSFAAACESSPAAAEPSDGGPSDGSAASLDGASGDDGSHSGDSGAPDRIAASSDASGDDGSPSSDGGADAASGEAASPSGDDADAALPAPYTLQLLKQAAIVSDGSQPNFQNATAPVRLAEPAFASVKLVVDLTSPCFPFSNWKTDRPPAGQNWPSDCDAFDRNFEMSLEDPGAKGAGAAAAIELQRAITPFGGPEHVETDVTDVFNGLHGAARTFKVYLDTHSDSMGQVSGSNGMWRVDAHLDVQPGPAPRHVVAVLPLEYAYVTVGGTAHALPFTLPAGTASAKIEYRVTGHGGGTEGMNDPYCIGPNDEFCKRTHTLTLDGAQLAKIQPWRTDCTKNCTMVSNDPSSPFGAYCKENPCGLPASVTAPRANWCPGTPTPPFSWTPAALNGPGAHTLSYAIDPIGMGGTWRVSALVYAYGP
ncbi:MAG TPA: peptide-N-glycosidase F-related protein [Polyangiaceae bacterium]|jgi:hypothetical protein|nr:peptide-N-glycosidase F-related protein [Polyangiaceae bacterium]